MMISGFFHFSAWVPSLRETAEKNRIEKNVCTLRVHKVTAVDFHRNGGLLGGPIGGRLSSPFECPVANAPRGRRICAENLGPQ